MQKLDFSEALEPVLAADSRYDKEAYLFLREALDYTIKHRKKGREETAGANHVSGQELLAGLRAYALKEFGPMVVTVFSYWGVRRCDDFGEMVYNLIRAGLFGKTETDRIEDFAGGYDFEEAFVQPFRPSTPLKQALAKAESERKPGGEVRK